MGRPAPLNLPVPPAAQLPGPMGGPWPCPPDRPGLRWPHPPSREVLPSCCPQAPSAAPRPCLCSPASLVPTGVSPQAAPASSGEGPALQRPPHLLGACNPLTGLWSPCRGRGSGGPHHPLQRPQPPAVAHPPGRQWPSSAGPLARSLGPGPAPPLHPPQSVSGQTQSLPSLSARPPLRSSRHQQPPSLLSPSIPSRLP